MLKKSVIHIIAVSVATAILTACGSSKSATTAAGNYKPAELSWPAKTETERLAPQSQAILSAAHSWLGVPYKYGGNDRKGVDCSGLVLQVYKDALGIPLPRNSREQRDYCTAIAKGSLIPGDLIFFATGKDRKQVSHVGIFIGDNLMIHASSSKGVILSDINSQYYTRTYAGSGIVDQYHSMIDDTSVRNPKKGIKPSKKGYRPSSQEGPVIHISQLESLGNGYTLTPVESLPVKADTIASQDTYATTATNVTATNTNTQPTTITTATSATPATESPKTAAPVKVATVSTTPQTEPTPEEARAAVLNSIKEKDL